MFSTSQPNAPEPIWFIRLAILAIGMRDIRITHSLRTNHRDNLATATRSPDGRVGILHFLLLLQNS